MFLILNIFDLSFKVIFFLELESRQGPTCHHSIARHHLPHHHRWPLRQELPRVPDVCPRKGGAPLHPGPHRHPPLLLPKHRGQGHPSASLEEMEKHSVSIGQSTRKVTTIHQRKVGISCTRSLIMIMSEMLSTITLGDTLPGTPSPWRVTTHATQTPPSSQPPGETHS